MDELLTKARLLEGVERTEQVEIPRLNGKVEIRPLTEAQWTEVRAIMVKDTTVTMSRRGSQIDAAIAQRNDSASDLLICRYGLVEEWTDKEFNRLPAGTLAEVSEKIQELSGVSKKPKNAEALKAAMAGFREEGIDDSLPSPERGSAS